MKKGLSLMHLLVVLVIMSIISYGIISSSYGDLRLKAVNITEGTNIAIIQRSVDEYYTIYHILPTLDGQPTQGIPKKVDFDMLSTFLLHSNEFKNNIKYYYWIDYVGKVYATTIDCPQNIEINGNIISWDLVKGAIGYNVGIFQNKATTSRIYNINTNTIYAGDLNFLKKFIEEQKQLNTEILKTEEVAINSTRARWTIPNDVQIDNVEKVYVQAIDKNGFSTPPVNVNFLVKQNVENNEQNNSSNENNSNVDNDIVDNNNNNNNNDNNINNDNNSTNNNEDNWWKKLFERWQEILKRIWKKWWGQNKYEIKNILENNYMLNKSIIIDNNDIEIDFTQANNMYKIQDVFEIKKQGRMYLKNEGLKIEGLKIKKKSKLFIPLKNPLTNITEPYYSDKYYSNYMIEITSKMSSDKKMLNEYIYLDAVFKGNNLKEYGWALKISKKEKKIELVRRTKGKNDNSYIPIVVATNVQNLEQFHKYKIYIQKLDTIQIITIYFDNQLLLDKYIVENITDYDGEIYIGVGTEGKSELVVKNIKFVSLEE